MSVATRSLAEACAEVAWGGEKRHMTGVRTTSRRALAPALAPALAIALALLLIIAGCTGGGSSSTEPPTGSTSGVPLGAEDPYADLGWPLREDEARIAAFPAQLDAAFDAGAQAGFRFLAERAWPDGFTADAMLACRTPEPTPSYRELDAQGFRYRFALGGPVPVPGFVYPPTGEYPSSLGVRTYLVRLTVRIERDGEVDEVFEEFDRIAVRADGTVVTFPTCFEFLPGGNLAHRVTDGRVGGYTDTEAEMDVRVIFERSPLSARSAVCEVLAAGDVDTLAQMVVPYGVDGVTTRVPERILTRTLTELCDARVS
jgi:hypothetical protein